MGQRGFSSYLDRWSGVRFVFKVDPDDPQVLHIFARHLTTVDEAIDTYFSAEAIWNEDHERFETYSGSHGLFWFWLKPGKVVMVLSCFRREDATWESEL